MIKKQKDNDGRTRFYVLPIESEAGFADMVKFVAQEFECNFSSLDEGPGTLVQKGTIGTSNLVFVLSDSTGAQFFIEEEKDIEIAEKIANGIEVRLREIQHRIPDK